MKITYTVVLYNNSEDQINNLYHNIVEATPKEFLYHIYFVNNSPDNHDLSTFLSTIQDQDVHFSAILPKKNLGFGSGNNLAIRKAHSDYHIIVNPDVLIPNSQQILSIIHYMIDENAVCVGPKIIGSNGKIQRLVKLPPTVFDMGIRFMGPHFFAKRQRKFVCWDEYDINHASNNMPGSFLVFKTDVLKRIGGFDERFFLYMEDADICRAMSLEGKCIYYSGAYVIHDWQRNNAKSLRGILQMLTSMFKYFSKWGWKIY